MTLLLLFNHPPLHEDLLNSAHHFIEQSHYGVAVVLAQTAFEASPRRYDLNSFRSDS